MSDINSIILLLKNGAKHITKLGIFKNNGLTIGEQKNAIEKFYTLLLTEFRDMTKHGNQRRCK